MKNIGINLSLCALIIMSACAHEVDLQESEEIVFETRATGNTPDGYRTYKLMTYNISNLGANSNIGTYEKLNGETILTPCLLDEEGNKVTASAAAHKNAQLQGVGYTYVIAVSPGIKHNSDGSFDFDPSAGPFLATERIRMNLGHMMTYDLGLMKDRRSRINIFIEAGQGESSTQEIEIKDLYLLGAGDGIVTYYPAVRQSLISDERMELEYKCDEINTKYSLRDPPYVMAGIYAPKSDAAKILGMTNDMTNINIGDYIYVSFQLKQNGRDWVHIQKSITNIVKELLPQNIYDFTFKVTSQYISLVLKISNLYDAQDPLHWGDKHILDNQEIGGEIPTVTINLGYFDLTSKKGWADKLLPEQEIK